jgi:hypothetical protein
MTIAASAFAGISSAGIWSARWRYTATAYPSRVRRCSNRRAIFSPRPRPEIGLAKISNWGMDSQFDFPVKEYIYNPFPAKAIIRLSQFNLD